MSITSALNTGVSGLVANSSALAAISDNIANVNTVGFKRNDTQFQDLVTAQGVETGAYTAGGTQALTRQLVSQQGEFQQTTSATDLAINGQGFFVTTTEPTNVAASEPRNFTRAGSFVADKLGYLRNSSGNYLQGWVADGNGVITTDPSDINKLQTINVNSLAGAAGATTQITVNANLDAGTTATDPTTYDATDNTKNMTGYTVAPAAGIKPDFTIPLNVIDSQGNRHPIEMRLLKTDANDWKYELVSPDGAISNGGTGTGASQIGAGDVTFSPSGQLLTPQTLALSIGASAVPPATSTGIAYASGAGLGAQAVTLQLGAAPGGITQFASTSVIQSTTNNGVSYGNLAGVKIDQQGFVTATYDNGVTRQIAQVAIATFPNPDGLNSVSGDSFQVSLASGAYNFKAPGQGGAGAISPSSLENSTVDLSNEFTGLISTQRAYSASSKIITTADQMLQELIDIKR